MKRCLAEGPDRFELWVGAAVLAKQQPHENRGNAHEAIVAPAKIRLTDV